MNRSAAQIRAALAVGALLIGAIWPATVVGAATFGTPSATAVYGTGVTFSQPFTPATGLRRVEILITLPEALGPLAIAVQTPTCCGSTTLSYTLAETDGHIVPNTHFSAQWRATATDGTTVLGDPVSVLYADTRFDWQTRNGSIVRVHWYQGSTAFGERALAIGEHGIAAAAQLLGVTERDPVDFYIYADQTAFYEALGPGTRENVGGEAHAEIRTMFALISPAEIDASWVSTVVPHELTHLVFDTAVRNPYHFPPRWLNEGLAVYLSEGYTDTWRATVTDAVRSSGILPLDGLTGQFPTTRDQFFLAYGESVSAVDFLVRTYGKDALVKLVRSYAGGVSDDEAFRTGIGKPVADFQAGWLADLGATAPSAVGPKPGLPGPLPAGWSAGSDVPAAPGNGPSGLFIAALALAVVAALAIVTVRRRARRPHAETAL